MGWMVSDRLGIARQPNETAAQAGPNVARLGDIPIAADGHLAEIARGFRDLCASLSNLKSELIDPAGPLSALCAAGARYLIRATERYGAILERSVRADVLVDGATRSLAIDAGLAQHADGLEVPPRAWAAEREALEDFDVPRFTLDPERPLFISPPDVPATAIVVPGGKAVRDRIATLDATQVAEELYILRASFHGRVGPSSPHVLAAPRLNPLAPGPPLDKIAALRWAARIASELQSQAIRGDDGSVTWLVPRLEHASEGYNLVPMGPALSSGLTGPALFFAALYRVSGDDEARRTAMAAVRTAIELVDHSHAGMGPGAATGLGSVAYTTIVAGLLLDEPEFFDHARVCAHLLMNIRRRDRDFDVSAGPGGAIVALLAVHARVGGDALIAGAEAFAERLIGDDGDRPACVTDAGTGLAHGAAGIAFALARLHAVSGRERWRRAAQALLRYERDVFDPVAGNWPDLRPARKATWARVHDGLVCRRTGNCARPARLLPRGSPCRCRSGRGHRRHAGRTSRCARPCLLRKHGPRGDPVRARTPIESPRSRGRCGRTRRTVGGSGRAHRDVYARVRPGDPDRASRFPSRSQRDRLCTAQARGTGGPAVRAHLVVARCL